jgi:ergothioneine biosynthesis protein EgtB
MTAAALCASNKLEFSHVRQLTELLAQPLSPEDQTVQSMPDASPTKWHRAHVTWFFETFVLAAHQDTVTGRAYEPLDERYNFLFNSYYEAAGDRHPRAQRGALSRPGAGEIGEYRSHVDEAMVALLANDLPGELRDLIQLGLHHEQQHQELLMMDAKHMLSLNPLRPAYGALPWPSASAGDRSWSSHPGGTIEIGHQSRGFSFDLECPQHQVLLRPFEIFNTLVTAGDWLDFIADDGYRRPELWMSEGWATVQSADWSAPLYWELGDDPRVFTLAGMREVDRGAPVDHISWFEADAFARWSGCRLPTESEWEVVAPEPTATNSAGWYGAVWQWTASAFAPYPAFRPAAGAVGEYNGKFMINQQVLRGSSWATPPGHARRTYRNFFPTSARWCVGGLRLARDA